MLIIFASSIHSIAVPLIVCSVVLVIRLPEGMSGKGCSEEESYWDFFHKVVGNTVLFAVEPVPGCRPSLTSGVPRSG